VPIWFTSIKLLLLLISDIYNALSTSNNIVLEWKLHYIDCLIEKLHYIDCLIEKLGIDNTWKLHYIDCLIERYWQYVKITLHRLPDREVLTFVIRWHNPNAVLDISALGQIGTYEDISALRQIGTFTDKSELWKIFNVFSCLFYI
jgi:hypothetical protein